MSVPGLDPLQESLDDRIEELEEEQKRQEERYEGDGSTPAVWDKVEPKIRRDVVEDCQEELDGELVDDGYDYDLILIDCPPDLSVLTDAAFIAAQNVFLAAQTQATSRDALDDLWDQLESIEDNQQIEIAIVGLLANMYRDDGQSQKFLEAFDESYASLAPIFKLPMRVAIQRAWDNGCDIFEWEDANDQQVERDLFLEVAETMERAFDKTQVEV